MRAILRVGLAVTTSVVAACSPGGHPPAVEALPSCTEVSYAQLAGTDTIGVMTQSVDDTAFAADVYAQSQGALLKVRGRLAPSGLVEQVHVAVWHVAADSTRPPTQVADVEFRDREAVSVVAAPTRGVQVQQDSIPIGAMPYMANIPVFLELVRRRADRLGPGTAEVPVLWLFTGGELDTVRLLAPSPDTMVMRLSAAEYRLAGTHNGHLAGGVVRSLGIVDTVPHSLVALGCR